jgi:predicted cobalt transporter CbtA
MGNLLLRGMLAGLFASLLAFGFAKVFGEPQVDRAITFEERASPNPDQATAHEVAQDHVNSHEHEELVSREVQASVGLLTGIVVYGTALGGLFALAFAFINGRIACLPSAGTALLLAGVGFLAIYLVPYLKYPANPPAVGRAETIGYRTQLYFTMVVFSLAALAIAVSSARHVIARFGVPKGVLVGSGIYLVLVALTTFALPSLNEVPETFPADVLWQFRVAALGTQFILWAGIGLAFGYLTEAARRRDAH